MSCCKPLTASARASFFQPIDLSPSAVRLVGVLTTTPRKVLDIFCDLALPCGSLGGTLSQLAYLLLPSGLTRLATRLLQTVLGLRKRSRARSFCAIETHWNCLLTTLARAAFSSAVWLSWRLNSCIRVSRVRAKAFKLTRCTTRFIESTLVAVVDFHQRWNRFAAGPAVDAALPMPVPAGARALPACARFGLACCAC